MDLFSNLMEAFYSNKIKPNPAYGAAQYPTVNPETGEETGTMWGNATGQVDPTIVKKFGTEDIVKRPSFFQSVLAPNSANVANRTNLAFQLAPFEQAQNRQAEDAMARQVFWRGMQLNPIKADQDLKLELNRNKEFQKVQDAQRLLRAKNQISLSNPQAFPTPDSVSDDYAQKWADTYDKVTPEIYGNAQRNILNNDAGLFRTLSDTDRNAANTGLLQSQEALGNAGLRSSLGTGATQTMLTDITAGNAVDKAYVDRGAIPRKAYVDYLNDQDSIRYSQDVRPLQRDAVIGQLEDTIANRPLEQANTRFSLYHGGLSPAQFPNSRLAPELTGNGFLYRNNPTFMSDAALRRQESMASLLGQGGMAPEEIAANAMGMAKMIPTVPTTPSSAPITEEIYGPPQLPPQQPAPQQQQQVVRPSIISDGKLLGIPMSSPRPAGMVDVIQPSTWGWSDAAKEWAMRNTQPEFAKWFFGSR